MNARSDASRRPTIADIARAAGVSKPTVSRVLNERPDVSEATRARVLAAVDELRYVPSHAAQTLRTGRTRTLGLVVPLHLWGWLSDIQRGVAAETARRGYSLLLHTLGEGPEAARAFTEETLPTMAVDGLVLLMADELLPHLDGSTLRGTPVVVVDDRDDAPGPVRIGVENEDGARALTQHLLAVGHRRIAFVGGPAEHAFVHERLAGHRAALATAGVPADPTLEFLTPGREPDAAETVRALLRHPDGAPDAVFAVHDELAYQLMAHLRAAGVDLPGAMAVVGFDDIPPSRVTHPPLTTVRQPFPQLGREAVRTALDLVDGLAVAPTHRLPTTLALRASCGAGLQTSVPGGPGRSADAPVPAVRRPAPPAEGHPTSTPSHPRQEPHGHDNDVDRTDTLRTTPRGPGRT
ncbi:LacI family DNA-binding transcriptional regulator (plasmid) [Streptomyces sp. BI20]|uniref:LacI family DNA-binding transcriptional regulator n=1 Tax=Streptomyces sp. BI20 TaxID=3403460 RepID=UPI003C70F104